jgi:NAD(P) transhydrogenase subunit alpha
MIVGTVRETHADERRVAITPHVVPSLVKAGCEVLIENGAGAAAGFPDAAYTAQGARLATDRDEVFRTADMVVQVRAGGANPERGAADLPRLRSGQVLVGFCEPLTALEADRALAQRGVTLFAMELVPRISRAQGMDALSSMSTVTGYKAVLLAAAHLPKLFPMLMTAAGTVAAARVFVVGAGVAGLQAIATARRLGAQVEAYDIRPAVKEQVQSLGAKFVEIDVQGTEAEDRGGYARAMGDEFYRRQAERMRGVVAASDVVVATAAVPGKRAPVLITADMVAAMRPGSVIVDLAAEQGGNCELTRVGATVVEHDVTILAPVNVASTVPYDASQLYARNVATLVRLLVKDGKLQLSLDDEIVRETLVAHAGEVVHPRVLEALGQPAATAGAGSRHQV